MQTRFLTLPLALLALAACQAAGEHDAAATETAAPAEMPSPEEMMAQMLAAAEPVAEHEALGAMVGTFKAKTTSWMMPGAPPEESEGTMVGRWILGGRFLVGEFKGSFAGQDFEGMSLMGFDRMRGEYVATWVDNFSTTPLPFSYGTSPDGKVITMHRKGWDPLIEAEIETRDVTTIISNDEHTLEMFSPGPDGKERRTMLIEYTRVE